MVNLACIMRETIREYALEELTQQHELEEVQQIHQAYFLSLVEQAEPHFTGAGQAEWINRLDRELDNIRAALQNAVERGKAETAVKLKRGVVAVLGICTAIWARDGAG